MRVEQVSHQLPLLVGQGAIAELMRNSLADERVSSSDTKRPIHARTFGHRPSVSEEDWLCLIAARDLGATCVTSDGALYRACLERRVDAWRGLRPFVVLVELGVLDARAAIATVRAIRATNAYMTTAVLRAFSVEIRLAARRARRRG